MKDLSIIIVNWHSAAFVRKCVQTVCETAQNVALEVIVVDSASFDGCDRMLAQTFPDVTYVQSEQNIGFARANNLGARLSKGKTLLFLNPDTEVLPGSIERLLQAAKSRDSVGIVGAKLLNSDGSLQTSCIQAFPTIVNQTLDSELLRGLTPRSYLWGMAALFTESECLSEVEAISGACMLVSKDVFTALGGFSEDYFMYSEDIDLCFKAVQRGYTNLFVPTASIVHHGGKSSARQCSAFAAVNIRESTWRYLRKFRGVPYASVFRMATACAAVVRVGAVGVLLPFYVIRKRLSKGLGTLNKWLAIMIWSFGSKSKVAGI